jgi:DNA-binding transcriptional LysR family regulator
METRYLNTLVVSVEAGTFSKASEILHITQSAVSQRIKFLEDHFGQQLLDRSGQRLALTTAGKVVFSKAKDILDKERELLSCLQTSNSRKRLSICCTPTFGMAYLPQVLNDFLRVHSDMNDLKFIFMQPEEALAGLRHEEFDFNGFDRYSMPDDEMLVVAASSMALPSVDGTVELEDLKGMRLFARRDGCSSKELMRRNLSSCGCSFDDFEGVIVSDDLRFTLQSVLAGDGIAYVSQALVSNYLASGELFGLRVQGFEHTRGRSVAVLPQRSEEGLLKALLESVFEVVSPFWRPKLVSNSA